MTLNEFLLILNEFLMNSNNKHFDADKIKLKINNMF